ncbi:hypothetical protein SAR116_2310 [Candidatus Puniceispirillum marinum IMCC1322]|uniref:Uncharacterized protein n=1 Tax=Puniceispirillum marinum (strain IMCC1322) TaxID=488538 RepID=D5BPQ1_PUNMI|nr:hypothetical protein SAR116_2310 [Candidatus Puniceispirillum marinum IMCC1322]
MPCYPVVYWRLSRRNSDVMNFIAIHKLRKILAFQLGRSMMAFILSPRNSAQ